MTDERGTGRAEPTMADAIRAVAAGEMVVLFGEDSNHVEEVRRRLSEIARECRLPRWCIAVVGDEPKRGEIDAAGAFYAKVQALDDSTIALLAIEGADQCPLCRAPLLVEPHERYCLVDLALVRVGLLMPKQRDEGRRILREAGRIV